MLPGFGKKRKTAKKFIVKGKRVEIFWTKNTTRTLTINKAMGL